METGPILLASGNEPAFVHGVRSWREAVLTASTDVDLHQTPGVRNVLSLRQL